MAEKTGLPLVSVLIPIYNSPDPAATLDSVLRQSYERLELIAVDDCSENFDPAAAEALIGERRTERLEKALVLKNEKNLGTVQTLRLALSQASGDYIVTLAGDDLLYDDEVIADWVAEFMRTGAELITGRCENYNEDFSDHLGALPRAKERALLTRYRGRELFEQFALYCLIPGASTAWKTQSLRKYGAFDTPYRLIEDYPLYLRLLRDGGAIHYFDRPVVRHRGGGVSAEENNISEQFEADSREIYQREILPYTERRPQVARRFRSWEKDLRFDRKYYELCRQHSGDRMVLCVLRCVYDCYHPVRALRSLKRRMKRGNRE